MKKCLKNTFIEGEQGHFIGRMMRKQDLDFCPNERVQSCQGSTWLTNIPGGWTIILVAVWEDFSKCKIHSLIPSNFQSTTQKYFGTKETFFAAFSLKA